MALPQEQATPLMELETAPRIDIETFSENDNLLTQIPRLLMTVKTWDNKALRASRAKAGVSGVNYGLDRRKELFGELGGLVLVDLVSGSFEKVDTLDLYGPRGLTIHKGLIYVGTTDKIKIFSKDFKQAGELIDDYGYWIHALDILEQGKQEYLLAGSSKLGTLLQFDLETKEIVSRWIGWENGFSESLSGALVTTDILAAQKRIAQGGTATVFNKLNPRLSLDVLTTSRQASRINGIFVTPEKEILLTIFSGQLIKLREVAEKVKPEVITTGLFNPHTPHAIDNDGCREYWVTNTNRGEVVHLNSDGEVLKAYAFSNSRVMSGKKPVWLQSTSVINGLMVAIDSTRQEFVIVDLVNQERKNVGFPDEKWAVQEVVPFDD